MACWSQQGKPAGELLHSTGTSNGPKLHRRPHPEQTLDVLITCALSQCAVDALCELNAIDTLLSNFIIPLQGDEISTVDPTTGKVPGWNSCM